MRKYLLAAAAAAAIASPAAARDGSGYVGIEGGLLFPRDINGGAFVNFDDADLDDLENNNAFDVDLKRGRDLDIIGGYDFGMFRLEGEIAWKRAGLNDIEIDQDILDELEDSDIAADDLDLDGRVKVRSIMANALLDFGDENGVSGFVGGGFGRARTTIGGMRDKGWAWQLLAGVRTAVSDNIDLGLKYRYFRGPRMGFAAEQDFVIDGGADPDITGTAGIFSNGRFRSHSLLASLIFNFAGPAAPPPPPVVEAAPPPPAAPATQTCPDGSVILATDACPVPPPPPPPAPTGERG